MRLPTLPDILILRKDVDDPELRKKLDAAITEILGEGVAELRRDARLRRWLVGGLGFGFLIVSGLTVLAVLLAAFGVLTLEQKYVTMLWTTFVVEGVGAIVYLLKRPSSS